MSDLVGMNGTEAAIGRREVVHSNDHQWHLVAIFDLLGRVASFPANKVHGSISLAF